MRVLVIDPDEARAQLVVDGLREMQPTEVRCAARVGDLGDYAPDVVVIACDSPDRDMLETVRRSSGPLAKPVVMFVDRSEPGFAQEAVEAGVAAYVVNGLAPGRVRPVVEVALGRFRMMQKMREDLEQAKSDLAQRKTIERAKGLLMKMRGLDEASAYAEMRKLAMDTGRPLHALAADLLALAGLTGDRKP